MLKKIKDKVKEMTDGSSTADVVENLCEHLRQIGMNATVESEKLKSLGAFSNSQIIGSVKVENRNIDLVEVEQQYHGGGRGPHGGSASRRILYRCNYVVQAKVEGLGEKLKAEVKPIKKGFLSNEVIDFKWEGKDLAQILNSDTNLKNMLYPPDKLALRNKGMIQLPLMEIKPYEKHQCVRISQKWVYPSPTSAFPTIETFEACDKIAQHIRGIANIRP